ncbi:MAG: hypothetical protein SW019_18665 [Actinomycetota bacterium]|nr:hypothetical protein [Actinomycetota bacterium]
MAGGRGSEGGGFAAVFVVLLVVGLVVKYFWWIAAGAGLVGLFFAGRALVRHLEERRELAAEARAALQRRADRQHRWMLSGDSRGVYGPDGAAVMRAVSPSADAVDATAPQDGIAALARTEDELAALARDKPSAWEQTLFASVLVQRQASLLPRLRDSELGFTPASTVPVYNGRELARILVGLIDEMFLTANQLESFTLAPAFMGSFGEPAEESGADPEAIMHVANRLMDYHERLLDISERCRRLSPPSQYADLLADCARLLDTPLQSFGEFIAEFVEVIESLPRVLQHATGTVHLGAIVLDIDFDDQLRARVFARLDAIGKA